MTGDGNARALRSLTAEIAGSYLKHHPRAAAEVSRVIRTIHDSLAALGPHSPTAEGALSPAVPVKRSVGADRLVCLGCGIELKTLKRHLRAVHDMDPKQYRERWGLPPTYPMVAPRYAEQRSHHAKSMGLGKRPAKR